MHDYPKSETRLGLPGLSLSPYRELLVVLYKCFPSRTNLTPLKFGVIFWALLTRDLRV